MNNPVFVVGDRVRMLHHGRPASLNDTGTVTMVFRSALDFYDVQLDTALNVRVLHRSDFERIVTKVTTP